MMSGIRTGSEPETALLQSNQTQPYTEDCGRYCAPWCSCSRRHYGRSQCLKSKAAILVLFWNMVILLIFQPALEPDILSSIFSKYYIYNNYIFIASLTYGLAVVPLLFFPLGGFIADVCFGRFKTLQCSLWNLWIAVAIVICSTSLLAIHSDWSFVITCVFGGIGGILVLVSCIFFSANVLQFGLDQLHDHSASDSSLFIYWYVWMYQLSLWLWKFSANWLFCLENSSQFGGIVPSMVFIIIIILLGYVALPITLCLVRCRRFGRWFTIEPGANNPYKLVYKVLKFAVKHDHPIQRSAFTYCEDELPSRLDLGKSKYGGPFTTEEVENVKCFGGIVCVLLSLGPIFVVELAATDSLSTFYIHLDFETVNYSTYIDPYNVNSYDYSPELKNNLASCLIFVTEELSSAIIVVLIPLYVYLLRPYLNCNSFGTLKRVATAIVLYTMSLLVTFIADTVGHRLDHKATCMFKDFLGGQYSEDDKPEPLTSINSNVVLIPTILNALAIVLFYTAAFEFICAQTPHSMKGLIIGTFFAIKGLFKFIGVAVFSIPFHFWGVHKSVPWLSCGFGYYLPNIVIAIVSFVVFILVARRYHYRQRDEPSNFRQFVENYYSNIQDEPGYDYDDLDEHEVYSVR